MFRRARAHELEGLQNTSGKDMLWKMCIRIWGGRDFQKMKTPHTKKKKHAGETEDIWGTIKRPN